MKEVVAVVRRDRGRQTLDMLQDAGFSATSMDALGKGRERGLLYPDGSGGIRFLPKTLITLRAEDDEVEQVIEVVSEANRTGEVGDGKIFVSPVETWRED